MSPLGAVLLRVAALPGSCRLHIGTSTHSALMLLDPHVSLHVNRQLSLLCELFDTDCALVFLDALMNLLMNVPCLCMNEPFPTTFMSTFMFSLPSVGLHVSCQFIFVATSFATLLTNYNLVCSVLVFSMVYQSWLCKECLATFFTVVVLNALMYQQMWL